MEGIKSILMIISLKTRIISSGVGSSFRTVFRISPVSTLLNIGELEKRGKEILYFFPLCEKSLDLSRSESVKT